jgi:hypothetical protein
MLLWGPKTAAAFDLWSFEHLANGLAMAASAELAVKKIFNQFEMRPALRKAVSFILVLTIALLWENLEHYIEAGMLPGQAGARITFWFQGVEHWSNRLVADNLMFILGWYIYTRKKSLVIAAKVFSTLWMIAHVFIFPDSMYLQRILFPQIISLLPHLPKM